ncbi:MAG: alpha/beta hydrolase [Candidatus Riflebacteria bacterium]|nr:alpha/beta hydrolase [Candidatus Riflebacteria bacterium]
MEQLFIDNKKCNIFLKGTRTPVFIYINEPSIPVGGSQIIECLEKINPQSNYIFIEILIDNWDKNLSPWFAKSKNNRVFAGEGTKTLEWLLNNLIPYIKQNFEEHKEVFLTGYSLSGLFALWALYETEDFDGIACCSGSLWFPDWEKYMLENSLKKESIIYLSLGGKEEKTKNPLMVSVGDNTRQQLKILKKDSLTKAVSLEMNPGGHFADTANRVAKGINWLMRFI